VLHLNRYNRLKRSFNSFKSVNQSRVHCTVALVKE
jgi:hypothetical protein